MRGLGRFDVDALAALTEADERAYEGDDWSAIIGTSVTARTTLAETVASDAARTGHPCSTRGIPVLGVRALEYFLIVGESTSVETNGSLIDTLLESYSLLSVLDFVINNQRFTLLRNLLDKYQCSSV